MIASGVTFPDALARLKRGRSYSPSVKRGAFSQLQRRSVNGDFYYTSRAGDVRPGRRYQVRFQLHGGVSARATVRAATAASAPPLAGAEQIYILPTSWVDAMWWNPPSSRISTPFSTR